MALSHTMSQALGSLEMPVKKIKIAETGPRTADSNLQKQGASSDLDMHKF